MAANGRHEKNLLASPTRKALVEAVDTTTTVYNFLLAGVERMAF